MPLEFHHYNKYFNARNYRKWAGRPGIDACHEQVFRPSPPLPVYFSAFRVLKTYSLISGSSGSLSAFMGLISMSVSSEK